MATIMANGSVTFGDGTSQNSAASSGFSNIVMYTANTSWTVPANIKKCKVTVIGGGGGGAAYNGSALGGGGGSGGISISYLTTVPADIFTVTVGTGGATSSVGNLSKFSNASVSIIATGGGAGGAAGVVGVGGTSSGGELNMSGLSGSGILYGRSGFGVLGIGGWGGGTVFQPTSGNVGAIIIEY